jgi:hypothetical protein
MTQNKRITLLIHGPVSIYTIMNLYRYREDYPIILVIPKPTTDDAILLLAEVQRMTNDAQYKMTLLTYDPSTTTTEQINLQNRHLHFFSVCFGNELCKTEYTIKIRSDEFYTTLDPFVKIMLDTKDKIVTTDVFFRRKKLYAMHPSDHLVGCKTKLMKEVFGLAKEYCENKEELTKHPFIKSALQRLESIDKLASEQILGMAALMVFIKNKTFKTFEENELMKEVFEIVPSDELGFFRIAANSQKIKHHHSKTYFNPDEDIDDINDYGVDE